MIPFFTSADNELAVIAVGERPLGIIAIGGEATGVIAIGVVATGVVALACGAARGGLAVSCGVACGALVIACGVGVGIKVGVIGLGVSVLDGVGMAIGIWPGPFPRRTPAAATIDLDALEALPPGKSGLVDVKVVSATGDRIELQAGAKRLTAHVPREAKSQVSHHVGNHMHARLRFDLQRDEAVGYRAAAERELVCEALLEPLGPPPPRGVWYARVLAAAVLALGIAAVVTPGLIW